MPQAMARSRFAYSLMARAAGIVMTRAGFLNPPETPFLPTKRFDRTDDGRKLHYQSLAGLCHFDFNAAGAYSYEQAFAVARKLGLGAGAHGKRCSPRGVQHPCPQSG